MRNNSQSAMLRMPSLLGSRNSSLHLWTSLERESIQPTYPPMEVGSSQSRTMSSRKGDLMAIVMVKLKLLSANAQHLVPRARPGPLDHVQYKEPWPAAVCGGRDVPSSRRPASRCRGTWRPPAGAQRHCTPV